jgi:uncharacterized membrane protein
MKRLERRLLSAGRHEPREPQAAGLAAHGLLRSEIAVRLDLIAEGMLLDAARVARGLRRTGGVVTDGLFEVVGQQCGLTKGEKLSPYSYTYRVWAESDERI